jgi:hypothetical protein
MITVRCSSLPRLTACAASATPPAIRIESPRGPASLGTAFHECMAGYIRDGSCEPDNIAADHNIDSKELWKLFGWARNLWRDVLAEHYPNPRVEVPLAFGDEQLTLTGHTDLMSIVPRELRIIDYKSGWTDDDATEQLKGYGFLGIATEAAFAERDGLPCDIEQVRVTKLQVREGRADTEVYTRDQLYAWWQWLKRHLADSETFRPSPLCGRCPRAMECPGHLQQLRALATVATD